MAKKKIHTWSEGELVDVFSLNRTDIAFPLLTAWLDASIELNEYEQITFEKIWKQAIKNISFWNEEDLKMNLIAFVIQLADLQSNDDIRTFYEKSIEATVAGYFLKTKTNFMIAKGVLDFVKTPYFHFQEYKKDKDPNGDPTAQLLEAFLIAQEMNKNGKPLYGCYVIGRYWYFVIMEAKTYCVSKSFDCTEKEDLLQIIAILRKFKHILETELL